MFTARESISNLDRQLLFGFAVSIALHAVLLVLLFGRTTIPPNMRVFNVDFVVEPPRLAPEAVRKEAPRQIVTPPEAGRNETPKETRLLSDVDSATNTEQIRRGDDLQAGPIAGGAAGAPRPPAAPAARQPRTPAAPKAPAPPRPPSAGAQSRPEPGKTALAKQLDLSPDLQLLTKLGQSGAKAPGGGITNPAEPEPFSRAPGSGARIIGFNGTSDYLPGVKDGDITMLNAKADKFAVFVRRVAIQVFDRLKQRNWDMLQARDVQLIRDDAVVRATLSPEGRLLAADVIETSASSRFDDALIQSVKEGARDPHPPPAALAEDGNFHFIFMAKSWVRTYSDPRTAGFGEQRWLLLKTGLE